MAEKLAGKVAVITGAGGGIGRAVAMDMAAEGAKIVVNDISKESDGTSLADKVVEEIKRANGDAVANYDTVATMAGGASIIKAAIDSFGRIDILVNTAGFSRAGLMVDMSEETWDTVIDVHLKGHFSCTQAAVREMIRQKSGGRIINFSSTAGFVFGAFPPFFGVSYATAKAGVVGFTAKLAGELQEHGITVNAIFPSAVTKGFPEERPKFGGGMTGSPDFVPPIVVYLATDDAKDITGQLFYATGGDIMIFDRPVQLRGHNKYIRKIGKWTVDELKDIIPPLLG
jgi:NAD(P)-dependent dehydrogenase (short-subunit alcohol dehydrogenase family)